MSLTIVVSHAARRGGIAPAGTHASAQADLKVRLYINTS